MPKLIANALLFQLGWLVCVFAGDSPWLLVVAAIIGVHLLWVTSWAAEGKLLLSVFLAGSALDSFLASILGFRHKHFIGFGLCFLFGDMPIRLCNLISLFHFFLSRF